MTPTLPARVAHQLQDILKWKLQLTPTYQTPQSPRLNTNHVQGGTPPGLPFGLDHIIDSTTTGGTDNPNEISSPAGIDKWLHFWVPWISYWTGTPPTYREQPGPWILQQLQEHQVFQTINTWDEDDQQAWKEYAAETTTVWHRLQQATGNTPLTRGTCPHCKTGRLQSHPTRNGYTDTATCNNHNCTTRVDYSDQEIRASMRATLRDPTITAWITTQNAQTIWPNLKPATLRKWAQRHHIRRNHDGHYHLGDINHRMHTRQ